MAQGATVSDHTYCPTSIYRLVITHVAWAFIVYARMHAVSQFPHTRKSAPGGLVTDRFTWVLTMT